MFMSSVREFGKDEVLYTSADVGQLMRIRDETGIEYDDDKVGLVSKCKYVVLAVKPGQYRQVCEEIRGSLTEGHIILSTMAGVGISEIQDALNNSKNREALNSPARVVRFMPNTAALVGESMTCICYSQNAYENSEREVIERFFNGFGKFIELPEGLMNAAICANGSSPAYVYIFIEALADSVVRYGIDRRTAYELVSQTVLGAAKMVLETKEHPATLKDNVCSPGGTTIAGINALEEYGFRNAVIQATKACYERADGISKK